MPVLKLKKCREHPDCQMESIDGSDWEHTPRDKPLTERLGPGVSQEEIERVTKKLVSSESFSMHGDIGEIRAGLQKVHDRTARLEKDLRRERIEREDLARKVQKL